MRIEIAGIIGSGKSSLAKLLLEEGFGIILEEFKLNPFWKAFYSNPNKYNFETEVTFLLQHYHELKRKLEQETDVVCDYSFIQDLAYAQMGLQQKQLDIFKSLYNFILKEIGEPSLLVHMYCLPNEALCRIKERARDEEKLIDEVFLFSLDQFITNEIANSNQIHYIKIDSEKYDIITSISDQKFVVQQIIKSLKH